LGWTHYWEREIEVPEENLASAARDCRTVFDSAAIDIAGGGGTGEPMLTPDVLLFNGRGAFGCEDFVFPRIQVPRRERPSGKVLGYCKTEHLPYDLCVQLTLIVLKHHLGNLLKVASDISDDGWQKARGICQKHLGYGAEFILEEIG